MNVIINAYSDKRCSESNSKNMYGTEQQFDSEKTV